MVQTLIISNDSLLAYGKKYYLKVYLDNCVSNMIDYLDDNIFESDKNQFHKFCITLELTKVKKMIILKVKTVKNV